jgi:hypothetical protein
VGARPGWGRTLDGHVGRDSNQRTARFSLDDVRAELDLRTERLATALSVPDETLVELQLLIDEVP